MYYLNARFYDATIARFLQEDTYWNTNNSIYGDNPQYIGDNPVPNQPAIIQSLNKYVYVMNNPLKYNDPTGYNANDKKLVYNNSAGDVVNKDLICINDTYYIKIKDAQEFVGGDFEIIEQVGTPDGNGLAPTALSTTINGKTVSLGNKNMLYNQGYVRLDGILNDGLPDSHNFVVFQDENVVVGSFGESQKNNSIQTWQVGNYMYYNVNMLIFGAGQNDTYAGGTKTFAEMNVESYTNLSGVTPGVDGNNVYTMVNVTQHDSSGMTTADINNMYRGNVDQKYVIMFTNISATERANLTYVPDDGKGNGGIRSGSQKNNLTWSLGDNHYISGFTHATSGWNETWYTNAISHEAMHSFGVGDSYVSGVPLTHAASNDAMRYPYNSINISNVHTFLMQEAIRTGLYQNWTGNGAVTENRRQVSFGNETGITDFVNRNGLIYR